MSRVTRISIISVFAVIPFLCSYTAANAVPTSAGLQVVAEIPVPNWATTPATGATNVSFDLLSFDTNRSVMYMADRVNAGVDAFNAQTNTFIGTIPVPGACTGIASCPSGVLAIPDLKELIVTDRGITNTAGCAAGTTCGRIMIYDISGSAVPTTPKFTIPLTNAKAPDELTYDPINHRVYVNNTDNTGGGFFTTVINPQTGQVIGQIPLPGNPEQPRFNPVDGLIYSTIASTDSVVRIDPNNPANGGAGAIVQTFSTAPGCSPSGIDVDPANDRAMVGCNSATGAPQELMNLASGAILASFPDVTRTDILLFDPFIGKFITGSGNNLNNVVGCPAAANNAGMFPVLGVFSPAGGEQIQCGGQRSTSVALDSFTGDIWAPMALFPASGPAGTNFFTGIVVFAPTAVTPEPSTLVLFGLGLLAIALYYHRSAQKLDFQSSERFRYGASERVPEQATPDDQSS